MTNSENQKRSSRGVNQYRVSSSLPRTPAIDQEQATPSLSEEDGDNSSSTSSDSSSSDDGSVWEDEAEEVDTGSRDSSTQKVLPLTETAPFDDNSPHGSVSNFDSTQAPEVSEVENEAANETLSATLPLKRPYNFHNRIPAPPKGPTRRDRWAGDLNMTSARKVRKTECCQKLKCFRKVDFDFYIDQSRIIFAFPQHCRETILRSFLGSDGKFFFNGVQVCGSFMKKGFHFGSSTVTRVRNNGSENSSSSPSSSIGATSATERSSNDQRNSSLVNAIEGHRKKKEAIVSFLYRLAADCGDLMPDKDEVHLPFHQRKELYPIFSDEFKMLYPSIDPPSRQYFRRVWKNNCARFKVMRAQRFSTCEECDRIRTAIKQTIVQGKSTDTLKAQRKLHLDFIFRERMEYQTKKDRARLHSSDFCSIIVDGADQSAYGLPHFTTKPKSQRGHSMKVKLIGLLEHRVLNRLTLFTMTEEHSTGANHVVEVIHRFLNKKREDGSLPPKLFVQLDNCSRENKNRYLLSYFEMLIALGVFDSIEVGFLPVGHTHEDVDQAFSQTSSRLRVHNAITLTDLHRELKETNKRNVDVEHMREVGNWSGLCDAENCLKKIDRVTQWRYFLFTKDPNNNFDVKEKPVQTKCFVKKDSIDQWQELYKSDMGENPRGILRFCPDLRKTPALRVVCPEGIENITKRLDSEEGRINDPQKMTQLCTLRDFVFRARVDDFHWDLRCTFETEICGMYQSTNTTNTSHGHIDLGEGSAIDSQLRAHSQYADDDNLDDVQPQNERHESLTDASTSNEPLSRQDYTVGHYVLVRHDGPSSASNRNMWLGQIVSVNRESGRSYAHSLKVHWYDRSTSTNDGRDILQCTFNACYQQRVRKSKKTSKSSLSRQRLDEPWMDTIHTDTVIVTFESLTKRRCLPLSVQSKVLSHGS